MLAAAGEVFPGRPIALNPWRRRLKRVNYFRGVSREFGWVNAGDLGVHL
jgi:hypothetical protein